MGQNKTKKHLGPTLTKTPGTYTKSDDPKITLKETLTYPMRYKTKTLTGVTPDIASHQHASTAWKNLD